MNQALKPAFDVNAILALHRDPGGYIGFVRKPDPAQPARLDRHGKPYTFENLFSVKTSDLQTMFPALAQWLVADSYMTVNAYHRAAPYRNRNTGLPDVWRKEKHLRTLAAAYSDIDCGRPDGDEPGAALSWRQALYEAGILADTGVIPQPSIMARSGRGCYLFWLLSDAKDKSKPLRAWPEKVTAYKLVNQALSERLRTARLPADLHAIDAARVLRVPGSIHRKAQRRVEYVIQAGADGNGFVYTLPELTDFLQLEAPDPGDLPEQARTLAAKRPAWRQTVEPGSVPARSHGRLALNAKRAADLLTLATHKGGWRQRGTKHADGSTSPGRRFLLSMYAGFLRGANETQAATLAAVQSMAAACKPAWPEPGDPTIEQLVETAYTDKPRRWSNKKLCSLLSVNECLARELDLQTIRPPQVDIDEHARTPTRLALVEARRAFAREYIERHGMKTARALANVYQASGYTGANPETANQDLNALGFVVRTNRQTRRRRHEQTAI